MPSVMATMIGPIAVGQQVALHDVAVRDADRLGGLDELHLLERQHLAAHETRDGHPRRQADRDEDQEQAVDSRPKAVSRNATDSRMMNSRSGNA